MVIDSDTEIDSENEELTLAMVAYFYLICYNKSNKFIYLPAYTDFLSNDTWSTTFCTIGLELGLGFP